MKDEKEIARKRNVGLVKYMLFGLFILSVICSSAAEEDSTNYRTPRNTSFIKRQIVPISLITAGALLNIGDFKYTIQESFPTTSTNIDDYLQYVPITQMYLADALGYESKNTAFDQTKYLLISQIISGAMVGVLKYTVPIDRPDAEPHSFPSGHTTRAFVSATVLFHEFKNTSPLLAWSGYVFATATGVLRVSNDEHWLPDVMVGAGIGILAANLVYHFEPLKNWQPFKKKNEMVFTPMISPSSLGVHVRF